MTDRSSDAPQQLLDVIREATARGWCSPENSHKEMDVVLASAIAAEVEKAVDYHYALRFAAIMTACIQNTPEAIKDRIGKNHPYWTVAYGDVCTAVDREMKLLAQRSERGLSADALLVARAFKEWDGNALPGWHGGMMGHSSSTTTSYTDGRVDDVKHHHRCPWCKGASEWVDVSVPLAHDRDCPSVAVDRVLNATTTPKGNDAT